MGPSRRLWLLFLPSDVKCFQPLNSGPHWGRQASSAAEAPLLLSLILTFRVWGLFRDVKG
jgi:hypothetical protein